MTPSRVEYEQLMKYELDLLKHEVKQDKHEKHVPVFV